MARTELDNLLSYGIDEKNRRINFGHIPGHDDDYSDNGGFTQGSVTLAIRAIQRMTSDGVSKHKPIEIHMNSYGGDPNAMLHLHDVIITTPVKFIFYGGGAIMSAATWIMCACDERNLYPNATIMIHKGSSWYEGNDTDNEIYNDANLALNDRLHKIYEENSRMPKSFWAEVTKRDVYLTAEETIMLGLADKVVHPIKRGQFRRARIAHLSKKIDSRRMRKLAKTIYERIKHNAKVEITLNEPPEEEIDQNIINKMEQAEKEHTDAVHKEEPTS